jgi:NAD(P)-dependent dehydrogenase (short-subunit alcohol dehydrogenase family)
MDPNGKVAVVTGAGSGIGRAMAQALAAAGGRVVAADINADAAAETARLVTVAGGAAAALRVDVTQSEDVAAMLAQARERFGGLDILCNNAGVGERRNDLWSDEQRWTRVVDINLTAVILGTSLGVAAMRATGGGVIVNTASMGGLFPMPNAPVYAATKAGVINFTRSLAYLAAEAGVRVCAICPSTVDTPILGAFDREELAAIAARLGMLAPERIAEGLLELVRDDTRAGAIMRVTTARGIDYARDLAP